jgi:hypothetical protein
MRANGKLLQLSIALPFMTCIACHKWGSVSYQNSQSRPFDYQKYFDSVKQLEMKIGVAHEQWKVNDPITVSVYLTNKGKNTVRIPDPRVTWYKYHISVIGENNRQVPIAEYTKDQLKWGAISSGAQGIEPGETIEEKVRINDIFELNRKGTYKITFKRQVGVADKVRHELTSNTITVPVVE